MTKLMAKDTIGETVYEITKIGLGDIGDNDGPVSSANPLPVTDSGATLPIDSTTGAVNIVEYEHHEIHSGRTFRVQHNQDNIPATGSGGELVIAFKT